jgi:aspartyl-tRNA synthetase
MGVNMAKSIRELPVMEQLAIEQALFSRLGEDVSTKNPDSLRSACDQQVVDNYRAMGAKSYDVHVNGSKVGTYSVRTSKEKPQEKKNRLVIKDPYALEKFIEDNIITYKKYQLEGMKA